MFIKQTAHRTAAFLGFRSTKRPPPPPCLERMVVLGRVTPFQCFITVPRLHCWDSLGYLSIRLIISLEIPRHFFNQSNFEI